MFSLLFLSWKSSNFIKHHYGKNYILIVSSVNIIAFVRTTKPGEPVGPWGPCAPGGPGSPTGPGKPVPPKKQNNRTNGN